MLTIITPGLCTTIQDQGRWGYQAYGMPVAGAMDAYAAQAANILVGNTAAAAVLEMTLMGAGMRFDAAAWVAVAGAAMQPKLNGKPVANWSSFYVPAGAELTFGYAEQGCRTYLAVRGGIDVPLVLGSRSTYTRGKIGGLEGRMLKAGDVLPVGEVSGVWRRGVTLPPEWVPCQENAVTLRVLPGPQDDYFTAEGLTTLWQSEYTVAAEADRMGYRLAGPAIAHAGNADIISDALAQGSIQVPGHGCPIVMMADRQTTGGYPKIGTVIGVDIARLAQLQPGGTVRFAPCSDTEAVAASAAQQAALQRITEFVTAAQQAAAGKVRRFTVQVNGVDYDVEVEEA